MLFDLGVSLTHKGFGAWCRSLPPFSARDNAAMPKALRDNGLTLALMLLFMLSLAGQTLTGLGKYNEDQHEHRRPDATYSEYPMGWS
jgi:hypothetical protein